jgi:hypothetical protein
MRGMTPAKELKPLAGFFIKRDSLDETYSRILIISQVVKLTSSGTKNSLIIAILLLQKIN